MRISDRVANYLRWRLFADEFDELGKIVKLEPSTSDANIQGQRHDPTVEGRLGTFELTPVQVEMKISELGHPPGTHAATILLQAQHEGHSEIMDTQGIIGIVALLGAVEGEQLNRYSVFNTQKYDMFGVYELISV